MTHSGEVHLIIGPIGAGKDTVANTINERNKDDSDVIVLHVKFVELAKRLVEQIHHVDLSFDMVYDGWKKIPGNREKLIDVAEGARKVFGEDFWAKETVHSMETMIEGAFENALYPIFVISDLRYPFEFKCVQKFCEKYGLALDVQFVNYKSERYALNRNQPGEQLPIYLVDKGYQPSTWTSRAFEEILKDYTKLHP